MESFLFFIVLIVISVCTLLIVYMYRSTPIVVQERVWPWALTPYSFWPYWFGGYSGGYSTSNRTSNRTSNIIHSSARRYSPPWGGEGRVANGIHGGGHSGGHGGGHSGGHGGGHGGGHSR